MTPGQAKGLVHAPLADWAQARGQAVAIESANQSLTFAALHAAITLRAQALSELQAPATVLVDSAQTLLQRLVDFLGIVASGRCAAVADPDWPPAVLQSVQAALAREASALPAPQEALPISAVAAPTVQPVGALPTAHPLSPFYVGYTSGSTGVPKGFRRHHRSWVESFRVCLQDLGPEAGARMLVPGRDAHSLFLFGMLLGLWSGGGVVVQERFSAAAALDTLRLGATPSLIAVPSQLVLMLDLARHRKLAPIEPVRLILISGARWMRSRTNALRALFPRARIIEFYGASETSFIAWMDSDASTPAAVVGRPFSNVELQIRQRADADAAGLIYVRSPMLFMDYVGAGTGMGTEATAALRDGDWLSVRDLGHLDAQGRLCLAGRQNRMIVTQGKNLFAEELEAVLEAHPAIALASVQGVEDARRGAQVVALIQWAADAPAAKPDALQLKAWCRQQLEAFKAPRQFFLCPDWPRTASGKTDHHQLELRLRAQLGTPAAAPEATAPCLIPWH